MNYKLSLHSHLSDIDHFRFTKPQHDIYLEKLLKRLLRLHGNLVLGVANFNNDGRYEAIIKGSKKLPKSFKIDYRFKDYFITIIHEDKIIHLVKTDEIQTREGHILIIGHKGKVKARLLSKLLREAHKERDIIIANHPLHKFGISYFFIKSILGKPSRISMSAKELKRFKNDSDAIELNSYFPQDWKTIRSFAKDNKIPLVSDSDAHFINEMFRSYYKVSNLSFENPQLFKRTFKRALKKQVIIHARKHGYLAAYKHMAILFIEVFLTKIGLVKRG
ncbi:MAG: hypothetical protein AABW65_00905 [Nanoarchaeota archaeon]